MQQIQEDHSKVFSLFRVPSEVRRQQNRLIGLIDSSQQMKPNWSTLQEVWNGMCFERDHARAIYYNKIVTLYKNPFMQQPHLGPSGAFSEAIQELNFLLNSENYNDTSVDIFIVNTSEIDETQTLQTLKITEQLIKSQHVKTELFLLSEKTLSPQLTEQLQKTFLSLTAFNFENGNSSFTQKLNSLSTIIDYLNIKLKKMIAPAPWIKNIQINHISSRDYLITSDVKEVIYIDRKGKECQLHQVEVYDETVLAQISRDLKHFYSLGESLSNKQLEQVLKLFQNLKSELNYCDLIKMNREIYFKFQDDFESRFQDFAMKKCPWNTYMQDNLWKNGITVQEYLLEAYNLVQFIKSGQIKEESSQEQSLISIQNQKEVLMDEDVIYMLEAGCSFHAPTYLTLVGQAAQFKFMQELFSMGEIISCPINNRTLDTASIFQNDKNEIILSGGTNIMEKANMVIPLYGPLDQDLTPFLQSKVFDVLVTFNLRRVISIADDLSYALCLAHYFQFLIKSPKKTTHYMDQLDHLYISYNFKYQNHERLNFKISQILSDNPYACFLDETDPHKVFDMDLIIFLLFIATRRAPALVQKNLEKIVYKAVQLKLATQLDEVQIKQGPPLLTKSTKRILIAQIVYSLSNCQFTVIQEIHAAVSDNLKKITKTFNPRVRGVNNQNQDTKLTYRGKISEFFLDQPLSDKLKQITNNLATLKNNNLELTNKILIFSDPLDSSIKSPDQRRSQTVSDLTKIDFTAVIQGCLRHLEGSHPKLFSENIQDYQTLEIRINALPKITHFRLHGRFYQICMNLNCPKFMIQYEFQTSLCNCRAKQPCELFKLIERNKNTYYNSVVEMVEVNSYPQIRIFYRNNKNFVKELVRCYQQRVK